VANDEGRILPAPHLEEGVENGGVRLDLDFEGVGMRLLVASPESRYGELDGGLPDWDYLDEFD
jgi:hypothetical protein